MSFGQNQFCQQTFGQHNIFVKSANLSLCVRIIDAFMKLLLVKYHFTKKHLIQQLVYVDLSIYVSNIDDFEQ
jgi:hypothetical protein